MGKKHVCDVVSLRAKHGQDSARASNSRGSPPASRRIRLLLAAIGRWCHRFRCHGRPFGRGRRAFGVIGRRVARPPCAARRVSAECTGNVVLKEMRHILLEEMRNVGLKGLARAVEEIGPRRARCQRQECRYRGENHEAENWFAFTGQAGLSLGSVVAPQLAITAVFYLWPR